MRFGLTEVHGKFARACSRMTCWSTVHRNGTVRCLLDGSVEASRCCVRVVRGGCARYVYRHATRNACRLKASRQVTTPHQPHTHATSRRRECMHPTYVLQQRRQPTTDGAVAMRARCATKCCQSTAASNDGGCSMTPCRQYVSQLSHMFAISSRRWRASSATDGQTRRRCLPRAREHGVDERSHNRETAMYTNRTN